MDLFLYFFLLLTGFTGLWYSAEKTVSNAEKAVASHSITGFGFATVFISLSTGLPEISTAVISILQGVPQLSAGDMIGSSLVNLTLILGATLITAGKIDIEEDDRSILKASTYVVIASSALLYFTGLLNPFNSVILLGLYIYSLKSPSFPGEASEKKGGTSLLFTLFGVAGLLVSARLIVHGTLGIGEIFSLPVELLGATVVAVGTGLPELAFSITSVKRDNYSMALGNIFGSTAVNMTLGTGLLGLSGAVSIVTLSSLIILITAVSVILIPQRKLSRTHGYFLILVFIGYLMLQFGPLT